MFTGLLMNTVYPILGIPEPISIISLTVTISMVVLTLCILCYIRDKDFYGPNIIDIKKVLSPTTLFLCLIPFFSIFGTYLVNFYNNNLLLIVLIIIIFLTVILTCFNILLPKKLYPLGIFIIAISLLFHRSLISGYVWGWDIHHELYLANLVISNSIWNPAIPYPTNAMLSITMLSPIYSILCNISSVWIFKIIYPLLFSLVPLGLYQIFRKQTSDRIAFLSCFFFVSLFTFYGEMLALARQQIAELFFVLLILLMIDKKMNKTTRSFLFILFGFSLTVSHYGLSYIYMFLLTLAWIILILIDNIKAHKLIRFFPNIFFRDGGKKNHYTQTMIDRKNNSIKISFVLLFSILTMTWYIYISWSSNFTQIVSIGGKILQSISAETLDPRAVQGLGLITSETSSLLHDITKYLHLITQFFIVIGFFTIFFKRCKEKFEKEYVIFSYIALAIITAAIIVPYFASTIGTTRLYHIMLIILSPFCIFGMKTIFQLFARSFKSYPAYIKDPLKFISVFFAVYLLFNTGFIYEIAGEDSSSISLNTKNDYSIAVYTSPEVLCAKWVTNVSNSSIFADGTSRWLLYGFGYSRLRDMPVHVSRIDYDSFIYLGSYNTREKTFRIEYKEKAYRITKIIDADVITKNRNKVYTNYVAELFY
jgi:uncharacterized membrane protein